MARNKLIDLNNHLFEQLERLNDDELTAEQLTHEISRTKSMTNISKQIISNGNLLLRAKQYVDEFGRHTGELPEMLTNDKPIKVGNEK